MKLFIELLDEIYMTISIFRCVSFSEHPVVLLHFILSSCSQFQMLHHTVLQQVFPRKARIHSHIKVFYDERNFTPVLILSTYQHISDIPIMKIKGINWQIEVKKNLRVSGNCYKASRFLDDYRITCNLTLSFHSYVFS